MTPQTEDIIKRAAYQFASRYRDTMNTTLVRSPQPTLQDRAQRLPPLGHDQLAPLIKAAYSNHRMEPSQLQSMWGYAAEIAKFDGWRPAGNYYEFFSKALPDLKIPSNTPRGGAADSRGFLCQILVIAHHRLTVDSQIKVTSDEVILDVQGKWQAALALRSITWRSGHYLIREKDMPEIDFKVWAKAPFLGQRMLSTEAAALRNGLINAMPAHQVYLDILFRCVALLGDDADSIVREPFFIDITDENMEQAWEVHSLLEAQRQLKGHR